MTNQYIELLYLNAKALTDTHHPQRHHLGLASWHLPLNTKSPLTCLRHNLEKLMSLTSACVLRVSLNTIVLPHVATFR